MRKALCRRKWTAKGVLALAAWLVQPLGTAAAAEPAEAAVLELGGAAEWPTRGGTANFGGTFAAEVTPIEDWLELEAGVALLGSNGRSELSSDILFKKPWTLSSRAELMLGAGPVWTRTFNGPDRGTTLSASFALDFMYWQWRGIGWYVEPAWNITPKTGERSIEVDGGLIVRLP